MYICHVHAHIHDFLIIHEMLRKKGKATQHNRKTKQHNTTRPRQYFSKKKAASGGTRTHDRLLARRRSYQLSYRGNSAGWARITYTIQSNQSTSTQASHGTVQYRCTCMLDRTATDLLDIPRQTTCMNPARDRTATDLLDIPRQTTCMNPASYAQDCMG